MEKVVLVNQSTGYLMIDIVNAYASHHEDVALIAGSIKQNERVLSEKVKTSHITAYNRASGIKRLMTWIAGTFQILFLLWFKYRGWKVVFVTNPPMSYLLSLVLRRNFSIIIYDIYPEALKNIGIKESSLLYRLWGNWNKRIFRRADVIYTLSDGMKKQLTVYGAEEKIRVIQNWSASTKLRPIDKKENPFVKQHGLEDKFVVLYSGNLGYTHRVESIIDVARKVKDDPDIVFLIIGEGGKKEDLIKNAKSNGLTNCRFLTWQDAEVMPYSLASADVAVITLNDDAAAVSVPSKTYNLLAVGAPLMCIASQQTELYKLVSRYDNGKCFDYGKTDEMASFVLKLKSDSTYRMHFSNNSVLASQSFTYKNAELYV